MASPLSRRRRLGCQRRGRPLYFPARSTIFDPEHPPRRVYLLDAGQVRLLSGPIAIIEQLQPGSFFGEKCFLGSRRSDQAATTLTPARVTAYGRAELVGCLRDRRFAARFVRNLALRLERCEQAIRGFVTERAERRLARLLFRSIPVRVRSDWVRLPLPETNEELARMIGTTRWSVSRLLNRFQRGGWLVRRRGLWVHREGLRTFLESGGEEDAAFRRGATGSEGGFANPPGIGA